MRRFTATWREKLVYGISLLLSAAIKLLSKVPTQPHNILCIRLDEIGDMCYTLPVFNALRKKYPNALITIWCKPTVAGLVSHNTDVNEVITAIEYYQSKPDIIIDLRPTPKSILFALRNVPKVRLDRATVRWANSRKGSHPHETVTNLQVIKPLVGEVEVPDFSITISAEDAMVAQRFIATNQLGNYGILHPGARKQLRQWDKYAELAKYLHQKGLQIVFTGDSSEQSIVQSIQSRLSFQTYSIAGLFSLTEFAALCKSAQLYVGNESGPLHIASLIGTPTVGLYGPGEPHVFYPIGSQSKILHHVLPCNPCNQLDCVHSESPCIKRISLQEVANAIDSLHLTIA
jgi:ADP-heptose:LPS heptosyltransferase